MAGYKINNGNMDNMVYYQKLAVICMQEQKRKYILENKGFLVVD